MARLRGSAQERVRDPPLRGRRGMKTLLAEERAGAIHQSVQLGTLSPHGLGRRAGIAELSAAKAVDGGDEVGQAPRIDVREAVHRPQRRAGPAQLSHLAGFDGASGPRERGRLRVARSDELARRNGIQLGEDALEQRRTLASARGAGR